jgi:hypothetical protein
VAANDFSCRKYGERCRELQAIAPCKTYVSEPAATMRPTSRNTLSTLFLPRAIARAKRGNDDWRSIEWPYD